MALRQLLLASLRRPVVAMTIPGAQASFCTARPAAASVADLGIPGVVPAEEVEIQAAPSALPHFELVTGAQMPSIGMGTFTGTRFNAKVPQGTMKETVKTWLRVGGRMVDCAANYLNEDEIGDALAESAEEGIVSREDVWVTSKLNNPYHRPEHVRPALEKSLLDLRQDSVDLYLMHWPTAFKYVPFDATRRGFPQEYEPDECSAITGTRWKDLPEDGDWPPPHLDTGVTIHETWQAMVELHKEGLAKAIGVCNFNVALLHELCCGTDTVPHVLQCESHPYQQQKRLLGFCKKNNIQFQAYSPLGYGEFAGADEVRVLQSPTVLAVAEKHSKSAAQVCLQWTVQRGVPTMPMSLKAHELAENLSVGTWALDEDDMQQMAALDKNYHYLDPQDWYGLPLWN